MVLQPRLYAGELLDLIASHCQLKEKEFFGLGKKLVVILGKCVFLM